MKVVTNEAGKQWKQLQMSLVNYKASYKSEQLEMSREQQIPNISKEE